MKPFVTLVAILSIAMALLASCAAPAGASDSPASDAAPSPPGRALYERRCCQCHSLVPPASRTPAEWRRIVPEMSRKAHLDPRSARLVQDYLVGAS